MKLSKAIVASVTLTIIMFVSLNVQAGDPARKLGRGICNVGFGPLEILMKGYDVNQEEGGFAAVTYGVFLGIGYCVAREVIGVTEIVTFLMPLPGCKDDPREDGWGYGPIMRPEWVVDQQHDIYNIIYQDLPVD
jgi:putative exosortase-associated protein (TIGR04073 family)